MEYSDDDDHWDEVAARMREEPDPAPRAARREFDLDEPVVLRGSKLTVNFWGVPANDAYLSDKGIGAPRGPTRTAEVQFKWEVDISDLTTACIVEDICSAVLQRRLGLKTDDMVGTKIKVTKVGPGQNSFFSPNWSYVEIDTPVIAVNVPSAKSECELTVYVPEATLFSARIAAAKSLYQHFLESAHKSLGYKLTDLVVAHIFGHSASTVKTALGLSPGKDATKSATVLSGVEETALKFLRTDFRDLAVEIAAFKLKGQGSRKRVEAPPGDFEEEELVPANTRTRTNLSKAVAAHIDGHVAAYDSFNSDADARARLYAQIKSTLAANADIDDALSAAVTTKVIKARLHNTSSQMKRRERLAAAAAAKAADATAGGAAASTAPAEEPGANGGAA